MLFQSNNIGCIIASNNHIINIQEKDHKIAREAASEGSIITTLDKTNIKNHTAKALKPGPRRLLRPINGMTNMTKKLGKARKSKRWLHINILGKNTMKKKCSTDPTDRKAIIKSLQVQ